MDKKRIGKDMTFTGSLLVNGQAVDLSTLNLTACMTAAKSGEEYPAQITTSGSNFSVTFSGKDQQEIGEHILTIWQNRGQAGQTAKDFRAVYLVARTYNEQDTLDGLDAETIELGEIIATGLVTEINKKQDKLPAGQLEALARIEISTTGKGEGNAAAVSEWADTEIGEQAGKYGYITSTDKGDALRLTSSVTLNAGQILSAKQTISAPVVIVSDDGWGYLEKLGELTADVKTYRAKESVSVRFAGISSLSYEITERTDKLADIEDDIAEISEKMATKEMVSNIIYDVADAAQVGEKMPVCAVYIYDGHVFLERRYFIDTNFNVCMALRYKIALQANPNVSDEKYFVFKLLSGARYQNVGVYTEDASDFIKGLFNA